MLCQILPSPAHMSSHYRGPTKPLEDAFQVMDVPVDKNIEVSRKVR